MNRIKFFVALLALCFSLFPAKADGLTVEQRRFRDGIMQFLKEEGFSPYIDDDDDSIDFKKEGKLHWISIDDGNPFYIEFHRAGLNCEDADADATLAAVNEGNRMVKSAKAIRNAKNISFVVEMFCYSQEDFKYVFYKCMSVLEQLEKVVQDYYDEHAWTGSSSSSSAPFTINSVDIANSDKSGNIITSFGSKIYSYNTQYLQPRINVSVRQEGTYEIFLKFYSSGTLSTSSSSPSGYTYKESITMSSGSGSYRINGWGNSTPGNWSAGNYRFEFYYNGKLVGQQSFTVY